MRPKFVTPGGTMRHGTLLRRATASAVSPMTSRTACERGFRPRTMRLAPRSSANLGTSVSGDVDANGDGISGRANRVWDIAGQRSVIGRFGWKAGQPSLDQQNSNAFAIDMGLTNGLFPADDCTPFQDCAVFPSGAGADAQPEVSDGIRAAVLFYTRNLAVPARRPSPTSSARAGSSAT